MTSTDQQFKITQFGKIPKDWEVKKIDEITSIVTDYVANWSFASIAANVEYKDEPDFATLIRLADYHNNFKWKFVYIDEHAYNFLSKSKLFWWEIIISNVGDVGTVFKCPFLNTKMSLAPNSIMVKFIWDDNFYYYWLNSRYWQYMINSIISWSAQPKFNKTSFKNLEVPVPSLPEQKAIAGILSSFDDKIELLKAENQTLEEMGQTLFKERFGKYKVGDEIPDGWKVGKLGDVVDNYDSKRIPIASDKREIWEYPYYWATGINWYVKDYIFDWIYTLLWEDWSVMKENWKPFTQYVWWKIRVNNHAHVLQWKNWFSTEMIKIILDSVDITPYVTWAVQLKISQWNMNSIPVIIPTDDVLVKFNSLINPIFAKIRANSEEIESLSKTRDQLLPKLMSWEVRVEF